MSVTKSKRKFGKWEWGHNLQELGPVQTTYCTVWGLWGHVIKRQFAFTSSVNFFQLLMSKKGTTYFLSIFFPNFFLHLHSNFLHLTFLYFDIFYFLSLWWWCIWGILTLLQYLPLFIIISILLCVTWSWDTFSVKFDYLLVTYGGCKLSCPWTKYSP